MSKQANQFPPANESKNSSVLGKAYLSLINFINLAVVYAKAGAAVLLFPQVQLDWPRGFLMVL